MTKIERIIGGAGTGKTAFMLEQMTRKREELRLAPSQIGFATFTRAGRAEMAKRAANSWRCGERELTHAGYFRTVHSTAIRQLGISKEQLLTDSPSDIEWIGKAVQADLTAGLDDNGDQVFGSLRNSGDEAAQALQLWNFSRNICTPMARVIEQRLEAGESIPSPDTIRDVIQRYETAKRLDDRHDFCDVLSRFAGVRCTLEGFSFGQPEGDCPGDVRAYFFDECQDASALVDHACRRLASSPSVSYVLLAGDPFQALYESFGGGSSRHFLSWDADESTMPRSYRCSPEVMELGERCLQQMRDGYFDRQISPADHRGEISIVGDPLDAVLECIDPLGSTLVVSRCSHTLRQYEEILAAQSLPFGRLNEGISPDVVGFKALWNLSRGQPIAGFDFQDALPLIVSRDPRGGRLLVRGAKHDWDRGAKNYVDIIVPEDGLEIAGCTPYFEDLILRGRWPEVLSPSQREACERWIPVAEKYGAEVACEPTIRTGTIHAAKGAEADTVILSTQTSRRVERARTLSSQRHDEECRVEYVGVTRARRRLILVEEGCRHRMELPL